MVGSPATLFGKTNAVVADFSVVEFSQELLSNSTRIRLDKNGPAFEHVASVQESPSLAMLLAIPSGGIPVLLPEFLLVVVLSIAGATVRATSHSSPTILRKLV